MMVRKMDKMQFTCPVCGGELTAGDGAWRCCRGHSFDVARQGYVNLLTTPRRHSAAPGDTREQVAARRAFLDGGFYAPIAQALERTARLYGAAGPMLDVGCGEGYYTAALARSLGTRPMGMDVSREAVRAASGRHKDGVWLCATASHIPVADGSVGTLSSLFALTLPEEFHRVLRPDGLYLQVLAAQDHLLGLKGLIYPRIFRREKNSQPDYPGFERIASVPIRFSFTVSGQQVQNLLYMTPHVYRIGPEGAERLRQTQCLTDTASCVLNVFRAV